ncbi:hypothetical protein Dimus_033370 [Dionaea muscipula]
MGDLNDWTNPYLAQQLIDPVKCLSNEIRNLYTAAQRLSTTTMSMATSMASTSCFISLPLPPKLLRRFKIPPIHTKLPQLCSISTIHSPRTPAARSTAPVDATVAEEYTTTEEEPISVSNLHRFVQLNLGEWTGFCYQFDANGNLQHKISTRLVAGSYGEDELMSLIQTLYIKQPPSSTFISGYDDEPEWAEYKIKESNMFTMDKYQQICFFPTERAFALRYQTAGMLETVLRQGVLGEDDTGEESPRNLKLPSRRPSIVCENCLYSLGKDRRSRVFHVMDPKGILEMLLVFFEERASEVQIAVSLENFEHDKNRILPFLGQWRGHSITKRSGIYGATIDEHDTVATLEMDEKGQLLQVISSTNKADSTTTNVPWTGMLSQNVIIFDKGFQVTLLPGGIYIGCPSDIAKSVAESKSFHLEFCWLDSSVRRQRLVRTFDAEGYAVSSTYFLETKI